MHCSQIVQYCTHPFGGLQPERSCSTRRVGGRLSAGARPGRFRDLRTPPRLSDCRRWPSLLRASLDASGVASPSVHGPVFPQSRWLPRRSRHQSPLRAAHGEQKHTRVEYSELSLGLPSSCRSVCHVCPRGSGLRAAPRPGVTIGPGGRRRHGFCESSPKS